MENWGRWEFSHQAEEGLKKICAELDPGEVLKDWLPLLNYKVSSRSDTCHMETDINTKEEEIINTFKNSLKSETVLSEKTFSGISIDSLSRVLLAVGSFLDEIGLCTFCKYISTWEDETLTEHSLRLIVLPKLKEINEASACVIFSIKELATNKPDELSQTVLIPLLTDTMYKFSDVELLSEVISALPASQKDVVIRKYVNKTEFVENDWLLFHLLIKDLSQSNLLNLLKSIQKFSYKFTKSQTFGRFLVNFCKNVEFVGNKDILRKVVENHQTLLKNQAMKYLE